MTTGEIQVRIAQMRDAASILRQSATRVGQSIEAVDLEVRALGADRFTSSGADVFRLEYQRLTPKLKEAFDLLTGFHSKLNEAADDIEAASRAMRS
jgi:WXG100 family type VII secretion target